MATRVPDGVSVRVVVVVVDSTCAALESDPETAALAATWAPMRDKADGLAKARLDSDREATRARARLAVCDAKWDAATARSVERWSMPRMVAEISCRTRASLAG